MINLSQNSVSHTAPANTVIGTLALLDSNGVNQLANWVLTKGSANYFATQAASQGASLITIRASIPTGFYAVKIRANAEHVSLKGTGCFVIQVV